MAEIRRVVDEYEAEDIAQRRPADDGGAEADVLRDMDRQRMALAAPVTPPQQILPPAVRELLTTTLREPSSLFVQDQTGHHGLGPGLASEPSSRPEA